MAPENKFFILNLDMIVVIPGPKNMISQSRVKNYECLDNSLENHAPVSLFPHNIY